jgi:hypothetical protein
MRVFVAVQPTPRGRVSSLSRYIAESKVDREREHLDERGSRPLFSAGEDDLTFKEADHILNPTNRQLEKEEVIHVVISPEPGSLERAGDDDDERHRTFREAIRDVLHAIQRELKVKCLAWIAGLHHNTRTPHAHIAVSRWALDAVTEKLRYIKHLPKSLLPHNTEGVDGEKRFLSGKIAEVFTSSLVRMLKPIRSVHLIDTVHGIAIDRSVASRYAQMLLGPTPEQLVVGKWLESALMLATGRTGELGREEVLSQYSELTIEVARNDAIARANGAPPPYIAVERLEGLLNAKTGNVQIKVSAAPLNLQDEKYVSVAPEQPPAGSANQPTKMEGHQPESEKVVAVIDQPREKGTASREPEKSVNFREDHAQREEQKQDAQRQIQNTRETVRSESKVKIEDPTRVGKLTLVDLRNHIQQGNVALNKPEITPPSNAQIHPVAVTKTDNGESKFGTDAPVRVLDATNSAPISSEDAPQTLDENYSIAPQETREWQIDDDDLRRLAGVAYVHFNRELDAARELATQEGATRSTFHVSSDYSSLGPRLERARYREAEILNTICLNACHERKLIPDVEGANRYVIDQIRAGRGQTVPLMEQMNMVRDYVEEIGIPSDQQLIKEFQQLHDLHSQLRPKVEYPHDIYETRDRELELEDTHIL